MFSSIFDFFISLRFYIFLITLFHQVRQYSEENNLPPKALLLVNNCSAHPPIQTDDGNVVTYFFPPNVTAAIQPMLGVSVCIRWFLEILIRCFNH